jgi:H+-transporting ATPase
VIGFWQEFKAANALEALKSQPALKARVLRDGQWHEIDAPELVPGDVIRLRLSDIIPADAKLIEGEYLAVDQSALTGESLPVNRNPAKSPIPARSPNKARWSRWSLPPAATLPSDAPPG